MGTMGNTFDVNTMKYGHARKVWREIRHRYPGGGMVSNISDWVAVGKIPAGTAVKFDLSGKTFTLIRTHRSRRLNQILPLLVLMAICKKMFL